MHAFSILECYYLRRPLHCSLLLILLKISLHDFQYYKRFQTIHFLLNHYLTLMKNEMQFSAPLYVIVGLERACLDQSVGWHSVSYSNSM